MLVYQRVLYIYIHTSMHVYICKAHPICEPLLDKANFEDKDSNPELWDQHPSFYDKIESSMEEMKHLTPGWDDLSQESHLGWNSWSPHHPPVIKGGNDHSKRMEVYGWDHRGFSVWIFHMDFQRPPENPPAVDPPAEEHLLRHPGGWRRSAGGSCDLSPGQRWMVALLQLTTQLCTLNVPVTVQWWREKRQLKTKAEA